MKEEKYITVKYFDTITIPRKIYFSSYFLDLKEIES